MQPQDIHLSDWQRILIGEVPVAFYFELLIRAAVVYLILMISMRSMGKRMSSQLSRNELAALVSLAAAVGIPMMTPDRGLLAALVIAFILIAIQRLIAKKGFKSEKFEHFSQGNVSTLVSDGVVDMNELERVSLSHERVFGQLRSQGVLQLGVVARLYMEASGTFTLVRSKNRQLAYLYYHHGMIHCAIAFVSIANNRYVCNVACRKKLWVIPIINVRIAAVKNGLLLLRKLPTINN